MSEQTKLFKEAFWFAIHPKSILLYLALLNFLIVSDIGAIIGMLLFQFSLQL
jgi:hypothetical protein